MASEEKKNSTSTSTGKYRKIRGFVALVVIAFAIAGLAFRIGSGTLSAFGIDQIAAICPLGALEVMLGAKEVLLHPLILFVIVVVAIVITGKAFCSWVCPTPWIQRFFRTGKKVQKSGTEAAEIADGTDGAADQEAVPAVAALTEEEKSELTAAMKSACSGESGEGSGCKTCLAAVGGKRDGFQLDSRHGVLLGALASAAVFGFPVFCLVCPIGLTFALIITLWNTFTANDPTWALLVIPLILAVELVFFRKWCSKICPMGALVSLISNANFTLKPRVKKDACLRNQGVDCKVCVNVCPEQVDPHSKSIPECTKCGACVEACPAHAIKIK